MNLLSIARKELLSFRDIRLTIFLLVLPSILILLLGSALTQMFNPLKTVGDIRVLAQNTASAGRIFEEWPAFNHKMLKSGIHFEPVPETMDGKREVQSGRYTGYVEISNTGLHYYASSEASLEGSIVRDTLAAFAARSNLAAEVAKMDPKRVSMALSGIDSGSDMEERVLKAPVRPGPLDYYSIAVTTLIVMYAATGAGNLIDGERKRNTMIRLMAAPISRSEIIIGKVMGSIVQQLLSILLAALISSVVFQVNWGGYGFGLVFLVLLTQVIFVLSLGISISYLLKDGAAKVVTMIIVQFSLFFGGSYFPVDNMTGIMKSLSTFSPLQWTNMAIIRIIHANDVAAAMPAIALNIGLAGCMLIIVLLMNRSQWRRRKSERYRLVGS